MPHRKPERLSTRPSGKLAPSLTPNCELSRTPSKRWATKRSKQAKPLNANGKRPPLSCRRKLGSCVASSIRTFPPAKDARDDFKSRANAALEEIREGLDEAAKVFE